MNAVDVNVLVYAHREDSNHHHKINQWLENELNSVSVWGLPAVAASGFLRIVTHPKIFKTPTPTEQAIQFLSNLMSLPNCKILNPGERHWELFIHLCNTYYLSGNWVSDAYLAAMAIEHGAKWVSADTDFAKFQELEWVNPLAG